jgi:arylsulfatase A-like enzyme
MPDFYYRLTGEGGTTHTYLTYLTGEKAENFIEHAPDDRPFCLSISFNAPHAEDRSPDQYIYPENLTDLYSDVTIPDPALGDESYFLQQPEFVRTGMNRIRWHWRFDTPEKYQKMVKGYYRMITAVDEVVGRLRDKLATQGKSNNTVIILLGDNGYFLGERGLAGKWLMYDNSLRVPLIIYDPRNDDNRRTDDHITLNIDIAPTVMDLAGVRIPEIIQGKSLVPLLHENPDGWRTEFFCEHLFNNPLIPKSQGIRTAKWKYFRYIEHPGYEELYDLEKDPLEINNLAGNPDYRKKKDELRKLSDEKFIQLGNVTDSSGKN